MSNGEKPITHEELLREFQEDPAFAAAWAVERPKAHLAANVLRFRDARGWTQQELARRAQMRQPRIAEIERGDANPTLETISRIAHALGLSVDALIRDPDRGTEGEYHRSAPPVMHSFEIGASADAVIWTTPASRIALEQGAANDNFAMSA
jgi:transcriptional regulator with XRE-family HTH domain